MPTDPLSLVNRGDPLDISADKANAWTEAARWVRKHKNDGGARPHLDPIVPSVIVIVRNDTGADLPARSVVRVDDWVVNPVSFPFEAAARPVLKGNTPNATTNCVAILRDAIPDGEWPAWSEAMQQERAEVIALMRRRDQHQADAIATRLIADGPEGVAVPDRLYFAVLVAVLRAHRALMHEAGR